MEANNNSEHNDEFQHSVESTTSRLGQSSSSTHLQDKPRDPKHKKRSPENDWNAASKNKDTSDTLKKQKNIEMEEINGNDQINGNQSYDVSGPLQQNTTPLQQIAATIPPNQPVIRLPPLYRNPYPPYFGCGPSDNYGDPSGGNYGMVQTSMDFCFPVIPLPFEPNFTPNAAVALSRAVLTRAREDHLRSISRFSEVEAIAVKEKLRNGETFKEGARILVSWLDGGECSKKNIKTFYSMLHSSNTYAKRLSNEKSRCEEEVEKAKENLDIKTRSIQLDLSELKKVYAAALKQRNWDHFAKNERRHIEDWRKEIEDISATLFAAHFEECGNEVKTENDELYQLRESNDTLKLQLTSTQKELDDYKQICNRYYEENIKLKSVSEESQKVESSEIPVENGYSESARKDVSVTNMQCVPDEVDVTENETCLVTLVSVFLYVHNFGANIDNICSYLLQTHPAITTRDIESLLRKFPNIFQEVSTGVGATLEKKWKYVAFYSSDRLNGH